MAQENGSSASEGPHLRLVPAASNVIAVNFREPTTSPVAETVDVGDPDPFGDWCYVIYRTEPCPCRDPKCRQIQMLGVAGDDEEATAIISDYVETKNGWLEQKMRGLSADERVSYGRLLLNVVAPGLKAVDLRGTKVIAERRPYGSWSENG